MQFLLLIALGAIAATVTQGQLSIPPRELGFVLGNGQADAKVKLAAYIDLTCPDSKAGFWPLQVVSSTYQPNQVQLKAYLFSLPYHRNSHTISKAAHVLNAYKEASVYDWFSAVYFYIDILSTAGSANKTDADVLNFLASLAYNVSGIPADQFKAGVSNADIDAATRLEWKYGCTRGVYGTPLFTINDVFVNIDATWTAAQWAQLINDLLNTSNTTVV